METEFEEMILLGIKLEDIWEDFMRDCCKEETIVTLRISLLLPHELI